MTEKPQQTPPARRRNRVLRPRFSMATLLIVMLMFAVLGAAVHYGLQAVGAGLRFESMVAILLVLAPPLMLVTLKLALLITRAGRGSDPRDE